jgi:hypothetical protein
MSAGIDCFGVSGRVGSGESQQDIVDAIDGDAGEIVMYIYATV